MISSCALVETSSFALRPTVVATVVEDGAVLLDLESKYFYQLNVTGWAIVQLFETEGVSSKEIAEQCRNWGAPEGDTSVAQFLASFERDGLIEASPKGQLVAPRFTGPWTAPRVERQAEPLQGLVTSAFDPSIPLAE